LTFASLDNDAQPKTKRARLPRVRTVRNLSFQKLENIQAPGVPAKEFRTV
jgi:hypothetical protein